MKNMNKNSNFNISNNQIKDDDIILAEIESEQELPWEILEKRRKGLLRTGYTTGTSASAATSRTTTPGSNAPSAAAPRRRRGSSTSSAQRRAASKSAGSE